jgi:hypothetical protein
MANKVPGPARDPNRYPVTQGEIRAFNECIENKHSEWNEVLAVVPKQYLYCVEARQIIEGSRVYKALHPPSRLVYSEGFKRVQCLFNAEIRPEPDAAALKMGKGDLEKALDKDWKETSRQLGLPNDVVMYCESHFRNADFREYMQAHIVDMVAQYHLTSFNKACEKQQHCAMVFSSRGVRAALGAEKCWKYVARILNVKPDSVPKKVQTWIMHDIANRYDSKVKTFNLEEADTDFQDALYEKGIENPGPEDILRFLQTRNEKTVTVPDMLNAVRELVYKNA